MRRLLSRIKGRVKRFNPLQKKSTADSNKLAGPNGSSAPNDDSHPILSTSEQSQRPLQIKNTTTTLQITLKNSTNSGSVYCYVTGQAINNNYNPVLLQADGQSLYYPSNPSQNGSPLAVNCAISLGAPGNSRNITIPYIAGGRIWFSIGSPLTFLLNPGGNNVPGLVEPSVTNQSDPNYNISWGFAEFTYNSSQMYANITFVDFVSFPIALSLTNTSGATQSVAGLPSGGLTTICNQLQAQTQNDGSQGWTDLIIRDKSGNLLRALSANNGNVINPGSFGNYFDSYVSSVLSHYTNGQTFTCSVNGQTYTGSCNPNSSSAAITLGSETFPKPNTADIFSSNSGPFVTGSDSLRNTFIPQLAAAFNRSTLLVSNTLPAPLSAFYQNAVTNHYSRIVHSVVSGGKGYAFPYDDVPPSSGGDQSGYVSDGAPTNMTVTVGTM
jgi:glycosyl hydrolase family 64 (putative beta-1,3-glucanase)